jgi:uncharacterized protein YdeI (YjbR/CyaY-like superfamily)
MDLLSELMSQSSAKSFRATLERTTSRLNWVIIHIPLDVAKIWGRRGQLRVRGEINGFAFRTSLFPTGKGGHVMIVNKRMQAGGRAVPGSTAQFRLEPDTEVRAVTMPAELKCALAEDRSLLRWFDRLNYSTRKEIAKWITEVKSVEARERRAEQIAERLLATMEAERELPPILQVAFAQDPRAHQGWELMSPSRRRLQLLAIFYYRSPEARARRVAKAVEEAAELAERRGRSGRRQKLDWDEG